MEFNAFKIQKIRKIVALKCAGVPYKWVSGGGGGVKMEGSDDCRKKRANIRWSMKVWTFSSLLSFRTRKLSRFQRLWNVLFHVFFWGERQLEKLQLPRFNHPVSKLRSFQLLCAIQTSWEEGDHGRLSSPSFTSSFSLAVAWRGTEMEHHTVWPLFILRLHHISKTSFLQVLLQR